MILKIKIFQKYYQFLEFSNYEHSEARTELTGWSTDDSFTTLELSIETLMEDVKPLTTERSLNLGLGRF